MPTTRKDRRTPPRPQPAAPPAPPVPAEGRAAAIAAGLAGVHLLLCFVAFNPTPHTGGDNAIFVSLARALLEGAGYVELWDPARPRHVLVPPVLPAFLAGVMSLGLTSWVALKAVIVAVSAAAVAVSYLWMRRAAAPGAALAAGVVLATAPGVVNLSHWVLSDVPFWALTMLALWAAARAGDGAADGRWVALAAAAAILALFTRSAGLPLVAALGGWLLLRREPRRAAAFTAAVAVPALLWRAYTAAGDAAGYGSQFLSVDPYRPELGTIGAADLLARIGANAWRYLSIHLPQLLVGSEAAWAVAVAAAAVLLAAAGYAARARRGGLEVLFLPLYLALVLAWPATWSGERFLLPVLPLLLLFAAEAAGRLAARTPRPRAAAGAAAAALVLAGLPAHARLATIGADCRADHAAGAVAPCRPPMWADFFSIAADARYALPPGSAVFSRKPTLFYHFSGHPGRLYPRDRDPRVFFREAAGAGIGYLVLDQLPDLAPHYLRPVVEGYPWRFCIMDRLSRPGAMMLRILPEGALAPEALAEVPRGETFFCENLPEAGGEAPR